MKTIKEQIEVMQHFDNGGKVKRMHKRGLEVIIYDNKDHRAHFSFNWNDYHYEIHKEVKPLFPNKEQGAKYAVIEPARICAVDSVITSEFDNYAKLGRTFYTIEDAEAFARREQAKIYCLEAINRVNGGDNGFKDPEIWSNFILHFEYEGFMIGVGCHTVLTSDPNEYIRTGEAAKELINDADFVENWKIWKGVE